MALKHDTSTLPSLNHISHSLSRATNPALPTPTTSCPHPYTPLPPSQPKPQRLQAVLLAEGTVIDSCGARKRLCHMTHLLALSSRGERAGAGHTSLSFPLQLPCEVGNCLKNKCFFLECVLSSVVCHKVASSWRDARLFAAVCFVVQGLK